MTIEKLDASTPDLTQQNVERLLELFPECRTEGSREDAPMVDFDLLRQALSNNLVEGPVERYRLDWPGKRQALLTANTPIDKTLRPMRDESVDFDTTRNLFIEGDNLDALKLLQETYLGKVKMIYIDPPYNTGNDFIYDDNFTISRGQYEESSGQRAETGGRLVANADSNGRFHSDWLSMMFPRLKLARNVLSDDGIICVSIDDDETRNMRAVLDQVFGSDNFLATIVWQKRYVANVTAKHLSDMHDFIHVYAKNAKNVSVFPWSLTSDQLKAYQNPDSDPRGPWRAQDLSASKPYAAGLFKITGPTGAIFSPPPNRYWRCNEQTFERWKSENRIWWGKETTARPMLKSFLSEKDATTTPHTWWDYNSSGHNKEATLEMKALFGGSSPFDTPKPVRLIRRLLSTFCREGVVMDFFSGSSTTAHAVLEANADENSNLTFVMVQGEEQSDGERETSIAAISRDRIRRAGKTVLNAHPELTGTFDVGFRSFRIESGNFIDTTLSAKEATQEALLGMVSHIKEDRSEEDLLFGALLRWGVDITLRIEQRELAGCTIWLVDPPEDGSGKAAALIACFARLGSGKGGIDTELADAIAELAPLRVLFRDDGFPDDATKENVHSRFQQRAPNTQIRVL